MPNEIELQLTIDASPREVYRALTEGDQLEQWFAEYADVSIDNGLYGFWGRLTPENPDRPQGRHKLLEAVPDERLRFEWLLRGEQTEVIVNLSEQGTGTRIRLEHFGIPTIRPGQYAVTDFWSLSMDNLRAWVERKQVGLQCDFGEVKLGDVRLEVNIEASPEEVFSTLIDPEKMSKYIANDPVVEPEVGGRYDYGWGSGPIKILELKPNQRLAHSWQFESEDEPETIVTWTLEGSGGKTRLTLVHSGFAPERPMEDYRVGWLHYLQRIKFFSELGDAWERPELRSSEYATP